LGARNVSKIKEVVNKKGSVEVDINYDDSLYSFGNGEVTNFRKMINISIGCDKKCTFCIVPHTRGTEISIPANLILDEVKKGVENGAKEFLLLGQNVNNYGRRFSAEHRKINFTQLLQEVSKIDGVERIRFTSPHPLHMDDDFIHEFATNPKIAKSIHIPAQSGSTKILKEMKRGYSKEWFLNRVEKIRNSVEDVSISTDIIVGFPNETDEDFEETMDILEKAKFEQMFSFKYSPRPTTEAENFPNQVSDEVASERLKRLQSRHLEILEDIAKKRLGKVYEVFFDVADEKTGCLIGRNSEGLIIKTKGDFKFLGQTKNVKITESNRTLAKGEII
jgi:tRNA-2-methylthio-N6-dimethylallyladenosine synthase